MWIFILFAFVAVTSADYANFPVKSENLSAADTVSFYKHVPAGAITGVEDQHPVHGIQVSDGAYVVCGKGLASGKHKPFCAKWSPSGGVSWSWTSVSGQEGVANAVVQLPSAGDLLVVGYLEVGGVAKRSLVKLELATGNAVWTATDFGDQSGSHGAWENIELASNGVLLCGSRNKPSKSEMSFKSYGNLPEGQAVLMHLASAKVAGTAPTSADATWAPVFSGYITSKAIRPLSNGDAVALLYSEAPAAKMATLVLLDSAGATKGGPWTVGDNHGEGSDMVVAKNETGYVITGHGTGSDTLEGRLTMVASNGTWNWTKAFTAGGSSKFIKNECWGLQALDDGFVMSCGTGIENCNGMSGTMRNDCLAGQALQVDTRSGAQMQKASVWQSLVIRTDVNGNRLWQRVDQYVPSGQPTLGQSGFEARSSASEYVAKTSDGGLFFTNDEVSGIGVMKLMPNGSAQTGQSSSPSSGSGNSGSSTNDGGDLNSAASAQHYLKALVIFLGGHLALSRAL